MECRLSSGKLIVLEGIDGAGKTSIARGLVTLLQQDGCTVLLTSEPSESSCGKRIHDIIREGCVRASPEAEFLLFAADRALHMREVVEPALRRGTIVIADRMGDSSIAYQGYGRGVDLAMIDTINAWVMRDVKPDLTVYCMIDYATAQKRLRERVSGVSGYDREQVEFFRAVIQGYEARYAQRRDVMRIDATLPVESLVHEVYHRVCALVGSDGQQHEL